ncbi:response regulator transcription factor [Acetobacterium wieringae]|jgi:DNA-binding response OmpR family regulator|uniref:Heme response regulator HssR n=1 Tax=Acetobacterium wieringae TaxID=52694 RepID=A0A5D0WSX2_9FIRM|nr:MULTISPECIES: response regulator transcription factor [Acetobacterium]OXS24500.1 MAG: DNA-binding response regulator [Acetobacterium sp. MES1]TYC87360.1 response regulator transcription factor [Acetobacterium wieringae]UYO63124.1 response regulator transcription factor [Acetobacterium wieringae]VUZ25811.1 Heme response regulator HssR [Acetobacterium wieringae]
MFRILICEDDNHIRRLFRDVLEKEGYSVFEAIDGVMALDALEKNHIDLLITDVMMPHMDGHALTKTLRDGGLELPILMITARESIDDKKSGFKAGTDDYMVKPVDMDEMLLRVFALLRRAKIANEQRLVVGKTVLDYEALTLSIGDETITLPKKEFLLLFKLLSAPNRIFTRAQIMDEIWGYESESDHRTVDVHIKRLREKLEHNQDFEIITVKGLGYKSRVL